jgi:molybdate transport system ATP-binding protein
VSLAVDLRVRRGAFELAAKFELPMKGVTVVFGPSGAGKSMLLSAIAGLAKLDAGRIAIGDEVLEDVAAKARMPAHQRGVGVVFQDARLFPHLSVRGNLEYAAKRAPEQPVGVDEIAAQLDIADKLDRPVRNLSGGEKSRVALGRALLSRSRLLLLDEPFAALDGALRRAFLRLILEASEKHALPMIVVTHQVEDAAELADRMIVMRGGQVVESGSADAVMNGPGLRGVLDARDVGSRLPMWMVAGRDTGLRTRGVWVRADTVLVASREPMGLSARNVWPGELARLETEPDGSVLATLKLGKGYILSRITPEAAAELELTVGRPAWAVVKAHAV